MRAKERYRQFCASEEAMPIFSQDWWLDSLAGPESWDVVLVEKGGQVLGSLPFCIRRRLGFTCFGMPSLTQSLGPWVRPTGGQSESELARQKEIMGKLIDQLPQYDRYVQSWHYRETNWLPFYWKGFYQTTRYTYVIDRVQDLDRVFGDFSASYRNKLRKASRIVEIGRGMEIDAFYKMVQLTFQRQGLRVPYSLECLARHDKVLADKNKREIFYAIDDEGAIHSALYLVWDSMSAYVHIVGEDPALRNSGAGILLVWESIKYTAEVLNLERYDFEGSMIEGVERVRRGCGAEQIPYFRVSKTSSCLLRIVEGLRWATSGSAE